MYSMKCFSLARTLGHVTFKFQLLHESCGKFLNGSHRLLTNIHNQNHHLCWKVENIQRKMYSLSFYQIRFKSSVETALPNKNNEPRFEESLRSELVNMRELGKNVPETISDADLEYYATLTSKRGRKKFLSFLFKRECLRKREKDKKRQRQAERPRNDEDDDLSGTMPINRILRRIAAGTILTNDNWRFASAMKFGPQIAFDFSFDKHMARPEVVSMVSQLTHVLNANKQARDPFHLHWTGLKEGGLSLKEMKRMLGDTFQNLMVSVSDKDVLDVFPHDKLVYLTADSANIMHTFNDDMVYIVGGLVDARTIQSGVTLAKAKRYNINHARFPLDLYLQWELGAKTLTLDQVARILHSMHETQDWTKALKNVPIRKHSGFKVNQTMKPNLIDKMQTRPELERYYHKQKEDIQRRQAMKETVITDNGRFSFSRAKREFKWGLLESENRTEGKAPQFSLSEEDERDFDPTGDTLFSSSENIDQNKRRSVNKKRGSKWFEK